MAPAPALTFPRAPLRVHGAERHYDVDGDGRVDFCLGPGRDAERLDVLQYDDDQDGRFDRSYRLSDHATADVPHLIVLVDSLPFRIVAPRHAAGEWRWFAPPSKVIPPFPSLTEVICSRMLQAPPLAGNIERYYDRRSAAIENLWVARAVGYEHPWQHRLDASLRTYLEVGASYVQPRPWYHGELAGVKHAFDNARGAVTLAYVVSSSPMVSRFGATGLDECLDELERLCLQLMYERQGALKLTIVSDHGHNLTPSTNFLMGDLLTAAGFRVVDRIEDPAHDVVLEIDGLITYFGVHCARPAAVADVLLPRDEVELATYLSGETVVVRDRHGLATIERRGDAYRYRAAVGDPLGYAPVLAALAAAGELDAEGFAPDAAWFRATADATFPDGPRRLWLAFHGLVINPPQLLVTLRDGHCAGLASMESFIAMASTHGGLNQISSDAVVLTMAGELPTCLRTEDLLLRLEPRLQSRLVR
jgi:hypothetical protein